MLRSYLRAEDVDRLVHTPTYWALIDAAHIESDRWTQIRREELRGSHWAVVDDGEMAGRTRSDVRPP